MVPESYYAYVSSLMCNSLIVKTPDSGMVLWEITNAFFYPVLKQLEITIQDNLEKKIKLSTIKQSGYHLFNLKKMKEINHVSPQIGVKDNR